MTTTTKTNGKSEDTKPSFWEGKGGETDDFELQAGTAWPGLLFELSEPQMTESKFGAREAFHMRFLIEPEEGRFVSVSKFLNVPKMENGRLMIHKKSHLHKALMALDPSKFADGKLKKGINMLDFIGKTASITLGERDGKDGAKFVNVESIGALVKGAKAPTMEQAKAFKGEDAPF